MYFYPVQTFTDHNHSQQPAPPCLTTVVPKVWPLDISDTQKLVRKQVLRPHSSPLIRNFGVKDKQFILINPKVILLFENNYFKQSKCPLIAEAIKQL